MGYIAAMKTNKNPRCAPLFVGDNLALDFINSEFGVDEAHQECLSSDDAVLVWLKLAGVLPGNIDKPPQGLLALALQLRKNAKALVTAARFGVCTEATTVNQILAAGYTPRELSWNKAGNTFQVVRVLREEDASSLLEPIAQSVVTLLTGTSPDLIRQCEAHDCTLMFHDKTKSHRRRWCSMATCGNRMKVAAFRSRTKEGTVEKLTMR